MGQTTQIIEQIIILAVLDPVTIVRSYNPRHALSAIPILSPARRQALVHDVLRKGPAKGFWMGGGGRGVHGRPASGRGTYPGPTILPPPHRRTCRMDRRQRRMTAATEDEEGAARTTTEASSSGAATRSCLPSLQTYCIIRLIKPCLLFLVLVRYTSRTHSRPLRSFPSGLTAFTGWNKIITDRQCRLQLKKIS